MSFNKETGMYEGYIYKIINDVNDKVYIGQTITTLKDRWHGHMSSALNEKDIKVHYIVLCENMEETNSIFKKCLIIQKIQKKN